MNNFIRRLLFVIKSFFSDVYLSGDQKTLIYLITLLFLGNGFSGAFVNTFLYATDGGLRSVLLFNIFNYGSVIVLSILVATIGRKISMKNCLILGMIFYIVVYVVLLIFQEKIGSYIWLIGISMALGSSFFYIPHSSLIFQMTDNKVRDYYFSKQGIFTTISSLIAPFLAGNAIQLIGGTAGYLAMFTLSLLMYLIAGILAFRLHVAKLINTKSYLFLTLRMATKRSNFRDVIIASIVRGLREGTMWVLAGTLLFAASSSSTSIVGTYNLVTSALLILSFYISQKLLRTDNRSNYLFLGVTFLAFPTLLFLLQLNPFIIFAYGILSSVFLAFFNTPTASIYFNTINSLPNSNRRSLEGMAIQETMMNIGRCSAVVVLYLLPNSQQYLIYAMIAAGFSQYIAWYFYSRAEKNTTSMQIII